MAQIGSGNGTSFPDAIDTHQVWRNGATPAPDSDTRVDSEFMNDTVRATVAIETTLGAKPNGDFASVAARLQQFIPGSGESPLYFGFTASTSVTIPGTTHNLGTASPLVQAYDNAAPRQSIQPDTVEIDTATYDVVVTFATPQSGVISLANPVPQYTTTFTAVSSVTVPGTTHLLGTALLFVSVYTLAGTKQVRQAGSVTIHPTSFDVVVTFATPQSGEICLSAAGPRYATTFTSVTTLTVLGSTHGLGSAALLYQVYDAATPRHLIEVNTLSVDPVTFTVVLTFVTPQSGTILLVGATGISGSEFQIRDRGVTDVNATRVYSQLGTLRLQMGSGAFLVIENATGGTAALFGDQGNFLITGEATKPAGASWVNPSDARLKTVLRPFTDGLELLLQMEPVWFVHNGLGGIRPDGREHVSLIAQTAQGIAAYLVGTVPGQLEPGGPATELMTLDTGPILYMLINAVKAMAATQQDQEARLARIEAALFPPEEG